MCQRGHEVVWPPGREGRPDLRRLAQCDVVHVYRRADDEARRVLAELARGGVGIVWDNDDDHTAVTSETPRRRLGGLAGQRLLSKQMRVARLASLVSTPSEVLAERYRRAGVGRVEVMGNYLPSGAIRGRRLHRGVVIGWVAGPEHRADVAASR